MVSPRVVLIPIAALSGVGAVIVPTAATASPAMEIRATDVALPMSGASVFFYEPDRELQDEWFPNITDADIAMLEFARSAKFEDMDYSEFYTTDDS